MIGTKNDMTAELNFLLNNISHALLFETLDHQIVFVNQHFCDLFKIPASPDILRGADCSNAAEQSAALFKYPDEFIESIKNTYEKGIPVNNEKLELSDGRVIYRDYKPTIHDPVFKGHLWIYKNATEIKTLLSDLRQQKDYYENLLNNTPVDIAIFNEKQQYIFISKVAIPDNNLRNWIIGKDDFEYCEYRQKPASLAINRRKYFTDALTTGNKVVFEEITHNKENKRIYNLRTFYPLKKEDGSIEQVIGYGINITDIREREEMLMQREQALRELVDSMDQIVLTINDQGKIIYRNHQWQKIIGYSDEETLGNKTSRFITKNRKAFIDNIIHFIKEGKYKSNKRILSISDIHGISHTLTYYFSEFTAFNLNERRFGIFFNDITAQLNAENELKRIARDERRLNQLKTNFISLVSHELRTPLSVILSSAELIEFTSIDSIHSTNRKPFVYTKRIIEQVDKMTQLMNDFLLITKVESGKIQIKRTVFDFTALVKKIQTEIYSPWNDGRTLKVSFSGVPYQISADHSMMSNILINIINNAFKYSIGKMSPCLSVKFTKKYLELKLEDKGIGISKEDMKRVFEPFTRGKNVGDIEGTGIGLMVVKLFVEKNNGTLQIKSEQDQGTTILIKFLADDLQNILKNH